MTIAKYSKLIIVCRLLNIFYYLDVKLNKQPQQISWSHLSRFTFRYSAEIAPILKELDLAECNKISTVYIMEERERERQSYAKRKAANRKKRQRLKRDKVDDIGSLYRC